MLTNSIEISTDSFHLSFVFNCRPELPIISLRGENLTKFPESGEIFAVDLGALGLFRAVRSDFIFRVSFQTVEAKDPANLFHSS